MCSRRLTKCQAVDGHMKELIALREQGAADKIVLLREKIKGEMEDINMYMTVKRFH